MQHHAVIYYHESEYPHLRFEHNKYWLKKRNKQNFLWKCSFNNGKCKSKVWTSPIKPDDTVFLIIDRYFENGNHCLHVPTLPQEDWDKECALFEMCTMAQRMSNHTAYDNWTLIHPQKFHFWHGYYP